MNTKLTIKAGPWRCFFSNKNVEMALAGHSHVCTVELYYTTTAGTQDNSFPSFENTHKVIHEKLREFFKGPFREHTNERIARELFHYMADAHEHKEIAQWGGNYWLARVDLGVQGLIDDIGHADGVTTYTVELP